ncbi:hypothetical protein EVAR_7946_1 [Eumeta japonica]|uniref:Uncharacterized protein n=1 Tax=Eumeta variegata TaxID=151549 RepID=A0A4C1TJU7_EUMVA|nr:hypothetical protein EVAR_7946_1 [Eumeta japonica]
MSSQRALSGRLIKRRLLEKLAPRRPPPPPDASACRPGPRVSKCQQISQRKLSHKTTAISVASSESASASASA